MKEAAKLGNTLKCYNHLIKIMAGHMVFLIHLLVDFVQFTVSYFFNMVDLCTCLLTMFMLVVAVFAEPSGCAMLAASQC